MIAVRRSLAVVAALVLTFALLATLIVQRVSATVLNPDYYKQQLLALNIYDLVHDEILPDELNGYLSEPERLPENFAAVEFPTDDGSRQLILDMLREAVPPAFLQAQTEAILDAFVPWITGRADGFELQLSLYEPIEAITAHAPGEPSTLRTVWRETGMSESVVNSLVSSSSARINEQPGDAGAPAGRNPLGASPIEAAGLDPLEVTEWFERELFAAIDELRPFFQGESEHFATAVRFDDFPIMAEALAPLLVRSPDELLTEGFVYSDADLEQALNARGGEDVFGELNDRLAIFRPEGLTLTDEMLLARDEATVAAGASSTETVRRWLGRAGLVRWGSVAFVLSTLATIAFLGGRAWWSRVAWAASALLFASVAGYVIAGPVYGAVARPRIESALVASMDSWTDGTRAILREPLIERGTAVTDGFAGGIATRSLLLAVASAVAIGGAAALRRHENRRDSQRAMMLVMRRAPVEERRAA